MINNVNKQYLRNLLKHAAHTTTFDFAITKFRENRLADSTKMVMEQARKNFPKVEGLTRIIKTKDLLDEEIYISLSRGDKILAGLALSLLVCAGYFPLEPHFQPNGKYRSGYRFMFSGDVKNVA
jgi:hypothetical protein